MAAAPTPVALVGATASGKSELAMLAVREVRALGAPPVEIVAVDSMQVYRGMDIGTAKPTEADRGEVVHHGLDLADPWTDFTVAEYQRAVLEVVDDAARRGVRPLLVAGTGLYLTAVIDRLDIPGTWPDLRAQLQLDAEQDLAASYERLRSIDPVAAARIEPGNVRRIVRALEVCLGSGRPFSSFGPGVETFPPSPVVQIGLRWQRAVLARRIEVRVQQMMAAGLLDEVRRLIDPSGPGLSRTALQALGYKELVAHLAGECSLDDAVEQIVARTRQFATRQDRWFRRDPRIRWIDIETDPRDAQSALVEALTR